MPVNQAAPLVIDPASDSDRRWAALLMAGAEPWRTLGRDLAACTAALAPAPDTDLLIARRGGTPLGFVLVRARGLAGSPYIASIAVTAEARGQGIGAHMVAHVEARCAPTARHLFLCVSSFNADAQRLYGRLGFSQVGELPDYVIAGASELILHKRLAP